MPSQVEEKVYGIYADSGKTREEVDAMYEELLGYSESFREYCIEGQNRLLCAGFFDYGNDWGYNYLSPYYLFSTDNYNAYTVAQCIGDFGPKWFLEVQSDGTLIVPFGSKTLPSMMGAVNMSVVGANDSATIWEPVSGCKGFPVEISSDYNTITIKPITVDGSVYYMNAASANGMMNPYGPMGSYIASDILLTRVR